MPYGRGRQAPGSGLKHILYALAPGLPRFCRALGTLPHSQVQTPPRFPPLLAHPIATHSPPGLEVKKNTLHGLFPFFFFFNFILKFQNYKDSKFFPAQITLV